MALLGVLNQPTMKCCQYEGLTSLSRGLSGSESAGKALGVHEWRAMASVGTLAECWRALEGFCHALASV